MRNFSIDIIWAKVQIACAAIGGWLGYFVGVRPETHGFPGRLCRLPQSN